MGESITLKHQQISAVIALRQKHLREWREAEHALDELGQAFPGWSLKECYLKATALNALYATNVFAINRMAVYIAKIMSTDDIAITSLDLSQGLTLLKTIAALPASNGGPAPRNHRSFASKFCHFFVDGKLFPMYDSYARKALRFHLGKRATKGIEQYDGFVASVQTLKDQAGLSCSWRELDYYLWLAGMYLTWKQDCNAKKNKKKTKRWRDDEFVRLFKKHPPELKAVLPLIPDTTL